MSPHSNHFHGALLFEHLVDQTVSDINSAGVGSCQVTYQLLIRWWRLIGVVAEDLKQSFCPGFQTCRCQFLSILLSLFGEDDCPAHQSSSLEHLDTGVLKPSRIDFLMPGMDSKYRVS